MSTATARHPEGLTPTPSTPSTPSHRAGRLPPLASVAGLVALTGAMFLPWMVSLVLAGAAAALGVGVLGVALAARGPGVGLGVAGLVTAFIALVVAVSSAFLPDLGLALIGGDSGAGGGGLPLPGPSPQPPPPAGQQEVVFLPPVGVQASATAADSQDAAGDPVTFDAGNAVDGDPTTAWRVPGDGVGNYLVLTFDRPVHVQEIAMIPGYAKVDPIDGTDRFLQNRRVQSADFEFSDGQVMTVSFLDQPVLQSASVGVETTEVTMRINTSIPAQRDFTAVSELQVYGWAVG
jgi:hypothetical protein